MCNYPDDTRHRSVRNYVEEVRWIYKHKSGGVSIMEWQQECSDGPEGPSVGEIEITSYTTAAGYDIDPGHEKMGKCFNLLESQN